VARMKTLATLGGAGGLPLNLDLRYFAMVNMETGRRGNSKRMTQGAQRADY